MQIILFYGNQIAILRVYAVRECFDRRDERARKKSTSSFDEVQFVLSSFYLKYYGFFVAAGEGDIAGFMLLFMGLALVAGFMVELPLLIVFEGEALTAGVETGATVATGTGVAALAAGFALTFTFAPASPQAMPSALKPRTVESTITFVILFSDSYLFSKMIYLYI